MLLLAMLVWCILSWPSVHKYCCNTIPSSQGTVGSANTSLAVALRLHQLQSVGKGVLLYSQGTALGARWALLHWSSTSYESKTMWTLGHSGPFLLLLLYVCVHTCTCVHPSVVWRSSEMGLLHCTACRENGSLELWICFVQGNVENVVNFEFIFVINTSFKHSLVFFLFFFSFPSLSSPSLPHMTEVATWTWNWTTGEFDLRQWWSTQQKPLPASAVSAFSIQMLPGCSSRRWGLPAVQAMHW